MQTPTRKRRPISHRNSAISLTYRLGLGLLLTATSACSGCEEELLLEHEGITLSYHQELKTLEVRGAGDKVLASLEIKDLAFRQSDASHEMMFGSFLVSDYPEEEWVVAQAGDATTDGQKLTVSLQAEGGDPLGKVELEALGSNRARVRLTGTDEARNRSRLRIACGADERFLGFGAQTHDVDHRGQEIPLWVSEQGIGKVDDDEVPVSWFLTGRRHSTHIPQPVAISSRAVAWAIDTEAYTRVNTCQISPDHVEMEVHDRELILELFDGTTPMEAMKNFTGWVGRPELPPAWAFAPWNDAIFGSESVRNFATLLNDEELPSSAIWSEDWKGGNWFGQAYRLEEDWRLDREIYPDFEQLTDDLRARGIQLMVYFNTFVFRAAEIFDEMNSNEFMVKDEDGAPIIFQGPNANFSEAGLVDLTNSDAVAFVGQELRQALDLGSRGWMADYAEWMPVDGAVLANGEDPAKVHNRYPRLWQELNERIIKEADLADEAIAFYRSGWLHCQPTARVIWLGDQNTTFDHQDGFKTVIPLGLGLASTGFPYLGHDIAGYQSSITPAATKELFFRWTSLGAFTPVMRTHHGTHASQNHRMEDDAETIAHWKRYAEIHIQLFPYLWGLAHQNRVDGTPLWRAMGLQHPDDLEMWGLKDQLYLGEGLMVAPVVDEGATSRSVRFPSGRFGSFWSDQVVQGPDTVVVEADPTEIPVFVAAGGLVPMLAEPVDTLLPNVEGLDGLEATEGDRLLHVGLGAEGEFTEASGARYELKGSGTGSATETEIVGNGQIEGDGWTLILTGHPEDRRTQVVVH